MKTKHAQPEILINDRKDIAVFYNYADNPETFYVDIKKKTVFEGSEDDALIWLNENFFSLEMRVWDYVMIRLGLK